MSLAGGSKLGTPPFVTTYESDLYLVVITFCEIFCDLAMLFAIFEIFHEKKEDYVPVVSAGCGWWLI